MIYLIDIISLIDMIDKKKQHQNQNHFSDIMKVMLMDQFVKIENLHVLKMMFYSVYILSKSI